MTKKLAEFIENDDHRLETLIEKYPIELPINQVATFLNIAPSSVRSAVQNGTIGLSWLSSGADKRGYAIPTPLFVRWYLKN